MELRPSADSDWAEYQLDLDARKIGDTWQVDAAFASFVPVAEISTATAQASALVNATVEAERALRSITIEMLEPTLTQNGDEVLMHVPARITNNDSVEHSVAFNANFTFTVEGGDTSRPVPMSGSIGPQLSNDISPDQYVTVPPGSSIVFEYVTDYAAGYALYEYFDHGETARFDPPLLTGYVIIPEEKVAADRAAAQRRAEATATHVAELNSEDAQAMAKVVRDSFDVVDSLYANACNPSIAARPLDEVFTDIALEYIPRNRSLPHVTDPGWVVRYYELLDLEIQDIDMLSPDSAEVLTRLSVRMHTVTACEDDQSRIEEQQVCYRYIMKKVQGRWLIADIHNFMYDSTDYGEFFAFCDD